MKRAVINLAAVLYGIGYAASRFIWNTIKTAKLNWSLGAAILVWKAPHLWELAKLAMQ